MENAQQRWVCGRFCTYFAVFVIFLFLGRSFECSCRPQRLDCSLYVALPFFITFLFVLWTDRSFHRVGRHLFSADRRHACSFLASCCRHITEAAFVALLWVVCVFIGGDWYVCCMNDHSEQQAKLACKNTGWLSEEERVMLAELRNTSRNIGSFLLFAIVCVPAVTQLFRWRKPSSGERQKLYHKLILEQEERVLKETLRKCARERLTEEFERRIESDRWEECFDVAEQLIKASAQPAAARASPGDES
ncbi:uncharacterized protein PAE49_011473 [Odontesthes bonariensis]|uniref:uncharacterized protein LOC142390155 n=1 Tax=Odontesthes bonariensis TaxID=219752 RepID=UPI003F58D936